MRVLVLADIHSNHTAFEAVVTDAERRGKTDAIWCLGDLVGYGPDPLECIAELKKLNAVCVAGNHDYAAAGKIFTGNFNPAAAEAAHWTAQQLSPADKEYLAGLPLGAEQQHVSLVHGSPREPLFEYIFSLEQAKENLLEFFTPCCFVGHTHTPAAFIFDDDGGSSMLELKDGQVVKLSSGFQIVNPGSVGQPRDRDPRASYGVFDTVDSTFTLHRVNYDIKSVQTRMQERGLPDMLWKRLGMGV